MTEVYKYTQVKKRKALSLFLVRVFEYKEESEGRVEKTSKKRKDKKTKKERRRS